MKGEQYLLLPGPTPIPERVRSAMDRPMINHRGSEFKDIYEEVLENVKKVYRTNANITIYPSSGTGGLEAAVVNFISPGEKVLAVSIGVFGDRFADIASRFGALVEKIDVPWGQGIEPDRIKEIIEKDTAHEIKAVLITHNETSTGAYNDVKAVKEAMGDHPALIIIDSVSGLAAVDLRMDEWNLDVVVSGSQKAFMIPPGLSFMAFSEKALEKHRRNRNTSYYWDIDFGIEYKKKGQTPFTPPVALFFGLQEALRMMMEEGIDNILRRHIKYRDLVRASIEEMGLKLLTEERFASPAVTSVVSPDNIGANEIRRFMLEEFNIVIAGGQKNLDNKIFRIGHLGYVRELDLVSVLTALEITLHHFGHPVEMGKGIKIAQEIILREHTGQ